MKAFLFSAIANAVQARAHCEKNGNVEWFHKHSDKVEKLCREHLPSGSGFDCGTVILWNRCKAEKLVFRVSFHHRDEHGGYDGWTNHDVTVTPSFIGTVNVHVSGRDRNGIKEYTAEQFHHCASIEVEY